MKSTFDTEKAVAFLTSKTRTVSEVAEQFAVTPATARKYVKAMVAANQITTAGVLQTGTKGRPSTLYAAANATA
jgi:predicted ArsR family transcriptional regulator